MAGEIKKFFTDLAAKQQPLPEEVTSLMTPSALFDLYEDTSMSNEEMTAEEVTAHIEQLTQDYFEAKAHCDEIDRKATLEKRKHSIIMTDCKEQLAKYIGVGKVESMRTQYGTVSTVVRPSYTTNNRSELDEWILSPILTEIDEEQHREVVRRLGVLSKTLSGEFCKEYRLDTGAEYATKTRITKGELPPSVVVNESPALGFRAPTGENLKNE